MNVRNMVILFLAVLAISLVILVIIFSLFFKNMDFSFSTHAPVTAPSLSEQFGGSPNHSKAEDVNQSNVRVPGDEPAASGQSGGRTQGAQQRLPEDEVYHQVDPGIGVTDPYAVTDSEPPLPGPTSDTPQRTEPSSRNGTGSTTTETGRPSSRQPVTPPTVAPGPPVPSGPPVPGHDAATE
jgi:hypothetical protein